jgi:hypothetical protein
MFGPRRSPNGLLCLPQSEQHRFGGRGEPDVAVVDPRRTGDVNVVAFEGEVDGAWCHPEFDGDLSAGDVLVTTAEPVGFAELSRSPQSSTADRRATISTRIASTLPSRCFAWPVAVRVSAGL